MSLLQFMPWCAGLQEGYAVGDISLIPYSRGSRLEGITCQEQTSIDLILASHKEITGSPVRKAALIRYKDYPVLSDLSDDELSQTQELLELFVFSALAARQFFSSIGPYCNTSCFAFYGQRFDGVPNFVGLISRRREMRNMSGHDLSGISITKPVCVEPIRRIAVDKGLLAALLNWKNTARPEEWSYWQHALSCFKMANSDDWIPHQVEWGLLASAFEQLLQAKSEARDVAARFSAVLSPHRNKTVEDGLRKPSSARPGELLRFSWMYEFYRVRGDFAHGKLDTKQPLTWGPQEHLVLATIAFPLVVRELLKQKGCYLLTAADHAQMDALEPLMDSAFLEPPADQQSSEDSVWSRLLEKAIWERPNVELEKKLKDLFFGTTEDG